MANGEFITVYVPDREPVRMPKSLTPEEVRGVLVGQGNSSLSSATLSVEPNGDIRFSRPQGGTKGL